VIQLESLLAVHAQPGVVTTAPIAVPPSLGNDRGVTVTANTQAAAWSTDTVCPATVNDPVRAAPVFTAAVNATVPPPLPVAPDVIVNQDVVVAAVHVHPAAAVTEIDGAAPPLAAIDASQTLDEIFATLTGRTNAVVVARDGRPVGVLTRSDLLEYLAHNH